MVMYVRHVHSVAIVRNKRFEYKAVVEHSSLINKGAPYCTNNAPHCAYQQLAYPLSKIYPKPHFTILTSNILFASAALRRTTRAFAAFRD